MKLLNILRRFRKDESGASMVEYGVALLVVVTVGAATLPLLATAVTNNVSAATGVVNTR